MFNSVIAVSPHLGSSGGLCCYRVNPPVLLLDAAPARAAAGRQRLAHRDLDGHGVLPGLATNVLGGVLQTETGENVSRRLPFFLFFKTILPRILGTAEGETTVVATVFTERIVAATELASHLLIRRASPRDCGQSRMS